MAIIDDQFLKDDEQIQAIINEFDGNIDDLFSIILGDSGSLLTMATVNIGVTNNIVEQAVRESGYYDTLNFMINNQYQMFVEDELDLLDRITKKTVVFSDETAQRLSALKEIDLQQFDEITRNFSRGSGYLTLEFSE